MALMGETVLNSGDGRGYWRPYPHAPSAIMDGQPSQTSLNAWGDCANPMPLTHFIDRRLCVFALITAWLSIAVPYNGIAEERRDYAWPLASPSYETLASRIAPPKGFLRVPVRPGSFSSWLRNLPLKPGGTLVRYHNGGLKFNQLFHYAVVDIDVGKGDLQQCADAVIRLRSEFLYAKGRLDDIAYNFTNGERVSFSRWRQGWRPKVDGKRVSWSKRASPGGGYASFRRYMNTIFAYAGTYSLQRELKPASVENMAIGDVFIQGGFPGHAVIVADMVRHKKTGEKRFLLIQSFIPAQDMHVLRNPRNPLTPWYALAPGATLITPEWIFRASDLRRFQEIAIN